MFVKGIFHLLCHIEAFGLPHRDCSRHIGRVNMHCRIIACTRSFDMGLISAEGLKLECFKQIAINIYISAVKV
jgi:hypothetical protein